MVAKVIQKQEIDTKDPTIVKYHKILEYIEVLAKSEKAI